MAARFGRNKRRRAREEIAALTQKLHEERVLLAHVGESDTMHRALAAHIGQERRRLQEEIDDAKAIAGPHSALFAPATLKADKASAGQRTWDIGASPPLECGPYAAIDDQAIAFRRVSLERIIESASWDWLSRHMHLRLEFGGREVGYVISEQTLQEWPMETLVRMITREVAPAIVRALIEKVKERRA